MKRVKCNQFECNRMFTPCLWRASDDKVALIMISTYVSHKEDNIIANINFRRVTEVSPLCDETEIRLLLKILMKHCVSWN